MQADKQRFWPWSRRTRLRVIVSLCLVGAGALLLTPPVPLGAGYHHFADQRPLLGIANCLDVLSNVPFIVVGFWGVFWLMGKVSRGAFLLPQERIPYLVFFAGVALTGIGSLWYHLAPDNRRLPWDLLPMTCSFMSMLAAIVMERVSVKAGLRSLLPLLVLGLASVAYWRLTESGGHGDYRFYLFVQFFPPVLIAAIVFLFPPRYTGLSFLTIAFGFFVLAKLFEMFDGQIYSFTGVVSGHSLKHMTAGVACYWILLMLQRRQALPGRGENRRGQSWLDYQRQTVG